jgi:hypothetical protein
VGEIVEMQEHQDQHQYHDWVRVAYHEQMIHLDSFVTGITVTCQNSELEAKAEYTNLITCYVISISSTKGTPKERAPGD